MESGDEGRGNRDGKRPRWKPNDRNYLVLLIGLVWIGLGVHGLLSNNWPYHQPKAGWGTYAKHQRIVLTGDPFLKPLALEKLAHL